MTAFASKRATLGIAFRIHLLWSIGMIVVAILQSLLAGEDNQVPAGWLPLFVPVLALIFLILFPVNAIAAMVLAAIRARPIPVIGGALLLGVVWLLIGSIWSGEPLRINETGVWTGIGGLAYGLAFVALIRRREPVHDPRA